MKQYQTALFIFRRDLRLEDNTALIAAAKKAHCILPCFIFDTQQIGPNNPFRSSNAIQFMIESIQDLNEQLKKKNGSLYLFYGTTDRVVEHLLKKITIDAIFTNRDYTPFSIKRDEKIKKLCIHYKAIFEQYGDALLNEPEEILKQDGTPYSIFTPFLKASLYHPIKKPDILPAIDFYQKKINESQRAKDVFKKIMPKINTQIHVHGGSRNARTLLKSLKTYINYQKQRDFPSIPTTNLSAHLKFGTVSVRTVHNAMSKILGIQHPLLRQLYWRDFFTHVAYHSPFVFGHAFHKKYDSLPWNPNKKDFMRWCTGTTGFPIVDAGMRQLNATGFMHNRVRMIVASFLTKDLHIDWRLGEQYFAQQLVDYDPAVNNGNWQWSASTGCDAQPYFRIFNPWLQQKKFDPTCSYIKKWVPELKKYSPEIIHAWQKQSTQHTTHYPSPMVDHQKESARAKTIYRNAKP
ncbi:MAG: Deoxyribodipyrimidine photo-lyase [Candidatus Dependentiae bacterium ADurb.Bin331]|nr:MAG: Deoxyribodipyrimidine photo-lyase [Candidatus Dependentiae bacterium ADurb.Bin331]